MLAVLLARQFQSTRPVKGATGPSANAENAAWFQSTRPVKGATDEWDCLDWRRAVVSIHAPREGRDASFLRARRLAAGGFNPRAP